MARALRCLVLITVFSSSNFLWAQTVDQLWFDYTLDYPFANKYLAEVEGSWQTKLSEKDKWTSYSLTPDFEVNISPRLDLIGQLILSYTDQTSTYNSFEVRPLFAAKYYFTPGGRIETRATLKYEHRMFHELIIDNWIISNRVRLQGEAIIPINKQSIYNDKMWYGVLEAEFFFILDQQVKERYANTIFYRAGIGYRSSYTWRFELFGLSQVSRDQFNQDNSTQQEIVRFRIKHFLNKATPTAGTTPR